MFSAINSFPNPHIYILSDMLYWVAAKKPAFAQRCLLPLPYLPLLEVYLGLPSVYHWPISKSHLELLPEIIMSPLSMYQDCERHLYRQDVSDCTM